MPMPEPESEIALIEAFADTKVVGMTVNHEHMDTAEIVAAINTYSSRLALPVTDALTCPEDELAEIVIGAFPSLGLRPLAAA